MPLQSKVKSGDELRIHAATFNTMIDAAQDYLNGRHHIRQQPQTMQHGSTVLVRNDSGFDCGRFNILGIDDIVISPADNLVHFQNSFALAVSIPTSIHAGKFVVLAEPIRDGKYGKAFVEGICPVQVNMNAEIDTEADILIGDRMRLDSGPGAAQIIYVEDGTGPKWALVKLGGGYAGLKPAKSQEGSADRSGNSSQLSVKLTNNNIEYGEAFNVYVMADKSSVSLAEYWPYIATGDPVSIYRRGQDWFLGYPQLFYVGKW